MSKFSCIRETVIPAVVKREIICKTEEFSCRAKLEVKDGAEKYIRLNTVNWNWDSVSLRELSDLVLQLADILDENNKETSDGWIPFVSTEDSVCPVPPDTFVSIKNGYWTDGSHYQRADKWHWCSFVHTKGSITYYKIK